jgi:hypothetical protein
MTRLGRLRAGVTRTGRCRKLAPTLPPLAGEKAGIPPGRVAIPLLACRSRGSRWAHAVRFFRPEVNAALGALALLAMAGIGLAFVGLTHRVRALERALCQERLATARRAQPLLDTMSLPADPCVALDQWLTMTARNPDPLRVVPRLAEPSLARRPAVTRASGPRLAPVRTVPARLGPLPADPR